MSDIPPRISATRNRGNAEGRSDTGREELAEARAEAMRSRATLSARLDMLRTQIGHQTKRLQERASPAAIRRNASSYLADEREVLVRDMKSRAKRHPLGTALLGSGLLLSASQMVAKVPKGLMMAAIGAFLISQDDSRTRSARKKPQPARSANRRGTAPISDPEATAATRNHTPVSPRRDDDTSVPAAIPRSASLPAQESNRRRRSDLSGVESPVGSDRRPVQGAGMPPNSKLGRSTVSSGNRDSLHWKRRPYRSKTAGPVAQTLEMAHEHPIATGILGIALGTALVMMPPRVAAGNSSMQGLRRAGKRVRTAVGDKSDTVRSGKARKIASSQPSTSSESLSSSTGDRPLKGSVGRHSRTAGSAPRNDTAVGNIDKPGKDTAQGDGKAQSPRTSMPRAASPADKARHGSKSSVTAGRSNAEGSRGKKGSA